MRHGSLRLFLALALFVAPYALSAATAQQILRITWPEHWEYREPQRQGPAIHLQAREQNDGVTLQMLDVTAIDTSSASKPITRDSIKELAGNLRDGSLKTSIEKSIPLREFSSHRGYYFVASDSRFVAAKKNSFKQMIEGVIFDRGALINFTLLTNDASSSNTQLIIGALSKLKVEESGTVTPPRVATKTSSSVD
jgi:hypothetical protein